MSPAKRFSPSTIQLAIQDVSGDLLNHLRDGTHPDEDQIGIWMDRLAWASAITDGLIIACEEIVEEGPSPEHLETMKRMLAYTQGQQEYRPRVCRR
ncbi:MAG: hypothetical protein ABI644_02255 [Arenimonas sp.]